MYNTIIKVLYVIINVINYFLYHVDNNTKIQNLCVNILTEMSTVYSIRAVYFVSKDQFGSNKSASYTIAVRIHYL